MRFLTALKEAPASAGALLMEATAAIMKRLPSSRRAALIARLGTLFSWFARDMRRSLDDNLRELFRLPPAKRRRMRNDVFRNFALTLGDFFIPDKIDVRVPSRARLEEARRQHGRLLVLTFHMGFWELGARLMSQWGWPVTAVYQPYRNARFKRMIESRRAPGVEFLPVGGKAAAGVRDALRRGGVVAMLGDHPFGEEGVPAEILGRRVLWPKGPILLAVRERTPIVVAVIVRTAPGRYEALIEEPLVPEERSRAEVQRLVQEVADKFSKLLLRYPTQWYRFRPFEFVEPIDRDPRTHRTAADIALPSRTSGK